MPRLAACPTALAEVRTALDRLGDAGNQVDVAMITDDLVDDLEFLERLDAT